MMIEFVVNIILHKMELFSNVVGGFHGFFCPQSRREVMHDAWGLCGLFKQVDSSSHLIVCDTWRELQGELEMQVKEGGEEA